MEFSVSDHQGVSIPGSPCCPGRIVLGPLGGKKLKVKANTDPPPPTPLLLPGDHAEGEHPGRGCE